MTVHEAAEWYISSRIALRITQDGSEEERFAIGACTDAYRALCDAVATANCLAAHERPDALELASDRSRSSPQAVESVALTPQASR